MFATLRTMADRSRLDGDEQHGRHQLRTGDAGTDARRTLQSGPEARLYDPDYFNLGTLLG
jgi:hypothetical protein